MNPTDSLARVAEVTRDGGSSAEDRNVTFGFAFRNFLDAFYATAPENRQGMIQEEPAFLRASLADGGVADAYLAALANHLAGQYGLRPPAWAAVTETKRIPDKPWFALNSPKSRIWLLTVSPAAFRERDLFIGGAEALSRA
jgi:hypothetical protein